MDKVINKEENLFIEYFDKELPALSQFPALLSVAISLFFKTFCDNHIIYKKGDILQYNKMRLDIKLVATTAAFVLNELMSILIFNSCDKLRIKLQKNVDFYRVL